MSDSEGKIESEWKAEHTIALTMNLDVWTVKNTMKLLDEDNSIPFIARYRKELTNGMQPDTIRELSRQYDELKIVQSKISAIAEAIIKQGKMNDQLKSEIRAAECIADLDTIYAPFKPGNKRSLAERARELGLEKYSKMLEKDPHNLTLEQAVNKDKEGLSSISEVETGVIHLVAECIAKNKMILEEVKYLVTVAMQSSSRVSVIMESSLSPKIKKLQSSKGAQISRDEAKLMADVDKFHLYADYKIPVKYLKDHQVLALNRGENLKILTIKQVLPDEYKQALERICFSKIYRGHHCQYSRQLVTKGFEDAFKRLIVPNTTRKIRSELTRRAMKSSIDVFCDNLKQLLMTAPVKGRSILGVDPGFSNGCKVAVISQSGKILATSVLYLHNRNKVAQVSQEQKLIRLIETHKCELVAIGNGVACRETEAIFSSLTKRGAFQPLNVMFCIVSESGASIYSASECAQTELPDLDVSLRGAVSIARRLQDPLAELVKIEPKHIGVGMYQHDIPESQLKTALDGTVEESVSFVGVDINICSEMLLRRVSGVGLSKAKKIIAWREEHGQIINREQLKSIKGLGPKSFEQCAGFIKILPTTLEEQVRNDECEEETAVVAPVSNRKRKTKEGGTLSKAKKKKNEVPTVPNPLDMTIIHPESYDAAERFISLIGLSKSNIGRISFVKSVKEAVSDKGIQDLSNDLQVGVPTMELIVKALQEPFGYDIRESFEKPLFRKSVRSMDELMVGTVLTGRISNMTHFGAFVDVGVGRDGLLHNSNISSQSLGKHSKLQTGFRVEASVESLDIRKNRFGLKLIKVL